MLKSRKKVDNAQEPLRAIVLDNDEASGYYLHIFDLWQTLQETSLGRDLSFRQILDFFIENSEKYHIFRPELFTFLETCVGLRDEGSIDAIIMYTHQNSEFTWDTWSVPAFLSVLMGHILALKMGRPLKRRLFDFVLTLPPEANQKDINGWTVKTFDRILNMYPWKPRDIRSILFVDDHASPKYIEADSINSDKKDLSSWYKVSPYRIAYGAGVYRQMIGDLVTSVGLTVPTLNDEDKVVIDRVASEASREGSPVPRNATYFAADRTFIDLDMYVRERFRDRKRLSSST